MERDFSRLTPRELNLELGKLFGQVPFDIYADSSPELGRELLEGRIGPEHHSIIMGMLRREKSEYRMILFEMLKKLLKFSRVTASCRRFILESFEILYSGGVGDELERREGKPIFFLAPDNPESDGIFDDVGAKEIEKQAYQDYLEAYSRVPLVATIVDDQGRECTLMLNHEKMAHFLKSWRQEFINLYGEEP